MKIALLIPRLGGGGAERVVTVLGNSLIHYGYNIHILSGPKADDEYEIDNKIIRVELYSKKNLVFNALALHSYLNKEKINICVSFGIYANLVASLANIKLKTHIIISERNAPKEDVLSWRSKLLRRLLYGRGDAYVFQTPDAMLYYSKEIRKRSMVIPNPLNDNLPYRVHDGRKEIVAVGRLRPQKNYLLLIDAFYNINRLHSDYTLRIFGKGDNENMIKDYVNKLGLKSKVIFEGYTSNVHEQIMHSDIYVLSSNYEGMPNALMEAMAMGFPVISTDCPCGGPRMLINNGVSGLLVPIKDSRALSDAILSFIENPQLKEKCAKNALSVFETCGKDKVLSQWNVLFKKVCNNEGNYNS